MCTPISYASKSSEFNCFQQNKKLTELTLLATAVISALGAVLALLGLSGYLPSYTLYLGLGAFALGALSLFLIRLAAKPRVSNEEMGQPSKTEKQKAPARNERTRPTKQNEPVPKKKNAKVPGRGKLKKVNTLASSKLEALPSQEGFAPLLNELEKGLDATECETYLPKLKNSGFDLYACETDSKQTALHLLILHPRVKVEILEAILHEFPVPQNRSLLDENGETPLHLAVKNRPSLISALIKGGVDWKQSGNPEEIPPLLAWDRRESHPDIFPLFYQLLKKDPLFVPSLYTYAINEGEYGKETFVELTKSWPIPLIDPSQAEELLLLAFQKLTLSQCASLLFSMPYGTNLKYTTKLKHAAGEKASHLAPILEKRGGKTYLLTPYDLIGRDDLDETVWQKGLEFYMTHSRTYLFEHRGMVNQEKDPQEKEPYIPHLPPMHLAAHRCRLDKISWLHEKNPDYLERFPPFRTSPIHTIGDHENALEILDALMDKGANYAQQDENSFNFAFAYAASGKLALLKKLIERYGTNTREVDSLLYVGATFGQVEVIDYLTTTYGANPRAQLGNSLYQDTTFHAAARNNQILALKKLLKIPTDKEGSEVDSSHRFFLDDFPTKKDFEIFIKKVGKKFKGFSYRKRYLSSCPPEVLALVTQYLPNRDLFNLALTGKILGEGPDGIQPALKARWIRLAATSPLELERKFMRETTAKRVDKEARTVILGKSKTDKSKGKPIYLREGWLKQLMLAWKDYQIKHPESKFISFLTAAYLAHRKEGESLTNAVHKQNILLRYINTLPKE